MCKANGKNAECLFLEKGSLERGRGIGGLNTSDVPETQHMYTLLLFFILPKRCRLWLNVLVILIRLSSTRSFPSLHLWLTLAKPLVHREPLPEERLTTVRASKLYLCCTAAPLSKVADQVHHVDPHKSTSTCAAPHTWLHRLSGILLPFFFSAVSSALLSSVVVILTSPRTSFLNKITPVRNQVTLLEVTNHNIIPSSLLTFYSMLTPHRSTHKKALGDVRISHFLSPTPWHPYTVLCTNS